MKLYLDPTTPNSLRVVIFLKEKGITDIELIKVSLRKLEHKAQDFQTINPFMRVPALELDDGRILTESRAICTYLEGLYPTPNLMGETFEERAFIEMADRRVEWNLFYNIAYYFRHTHPMLIIFENPQFPDYGNSLLAKSHEYFKIFDTLLQKQEWMAGERFTIADITGFVALGLATMLGQDLGIDKYPAFYDWSKRVAARPSTQLK